MRLSSSLKGESCVALPPPREYLDGCGVMNADFDEFGVETSKLLLSLEWFLLLE